MKFCKIVVKDEIQNYLLHWNGPRNLENGETGSTKGTHLLYF